MPLKVVRNDITKMNTEAIVNTASEEPDVGTGCDWAIYNAAGYDELFKLRKEIGYKNEGEVFITPGFRLKAKYIIHAVSPLYVDGSFGEEDKLRSCYRSSLNLAKEQGIKSISFPLIATGNYGFPRAHGLRIAVDEINTFLLENEMDINLVVFDTFSTELAEKLHPRIEAFIGHDDVCRIREEEYGDAHFNAVAPYEEGYDKYAKRAYELDKRLSEGNDYSSTLKTIETKGKVSVDKIDFDEDLDLEVLGKKIDLVEEPFGVYLMNLSQRQGKTLTELENTAWISKHIVFKVRKNPNEYRPDKRTAFQFCVGLELSLDETRDLLARAGYAINPSSLEDKIWEFYIENEHYDVIDISDSLEHYGLKPIINF